jgi:hypothetical protein
MIKRVYTGVISASFAQFAQKGALKKPTGGLKIIPERKDQHFTHGDIHLPQN